MCPLRLILIFLSATLAGFFVLRGLKAKPADDCDDDLTESPSSSAAAAAAGESMIPQDCPSLSCCAKQVGSAIRTGFWTCVDMASGRYLWRNLVSPPPPAATAASTAAAAEDKKQM